MKRTFRTQPQCTATSSLGLRCGHSALVDSDRCQFHPRSQEEIPAIQEEILDPPVVEIQNTPPNDPPVEFTSAQEFAKAVLESQEFFSYVLSGLASRKIPAALLLRLMDYADGWGKPPERVEHTGKDGEAIVTEVRRVIVHTMPEEPKLSQQLPQISSITPDVEIEDGDMDIPMIPVAPRKMH